MSFARKLVFSVTLADGEIDPSMHIRGVPQIAIRGTGCGRSSMFEKKRRYHLDQRCDDGISRRSRDGAVELHVMHEKQLRVVHAREQAGHFLGDGR